jgi:hypothetical protein
MEWLDGRTGTMAMLCKTTVARKLLQYAWRNPMRLADVSLYAIDAVAHFGASVDACLLVCDFHPRRRAITASVFESLTAESPSSRLGWRQGQVVANAAAFDRWGHLAGGNGKAKPLWRSGVKHDCANVMELRDEGGALRNRLGDAVQIEPTYVYPLRKSADIAHARRGRPRHWMIVTQSSASASTDGIRNLAPRTWEYLCSHAQALDSRRSSIYRRRPRFSVFGVGPYTFARYKVAISGFYKRLRFALVEPYRGRPTVLDDTAYFLPCQRRSDAKFLLELLDSDAAREFYSALVFWDAKRPVTAELLRQLNLVRLAEELGQGDRFRSMEV